MLGLLGACGDRCESLCTELSFQIEECKETDPNWGAVSWGDLGARSRRDFAVDCRQDWNRNSALLATHELEESLDLCGDSRTSLEEITCGELLDLYAPQ